MASTRAVRPLPLAPIGYRRDGRPILPILGASSDDPDNQPPTGDLDPGAVAIPQHELSKLFAREKDQGRRAGVRDLLGQLGFESPKALNDFVEVQRDAEQARKDAERALLTEAEQRAQSVAEREQELERLEAAAIARERDAARRAVLVGLGAVGAELEDAAVLLARLVDADADETAVTAAAGELKTRRPELFGHQALTTPPSGVPTGGPPPQAGGTPARPGSRGLDIARRRGHFSTS